MSGDFDVVDIEGAFDNGGPGGEARGGKGKGMSLFVSTTETVEPSRFDTMPSQPSLQARR
jgi:hypothetical protein